MNDFRELENELRKLRPARPSPALFERIGEALKESRAATAVHSSVKRQGFREARHNWWSLGFGLAAAAVLILFAVVTIERRQEHRQTTAQNSPASETQRAPAGKGSSMSRSRFVPAGGTNVVFNARDEGLHFAGGSERPVRQVRYNTQQTWRWRNPETGASLRVSYPSEEIVLIPVSGQ